MRHTELDRAVAIKGSGAFRPLTLAVAAPRSSCAAVNVSLGRLRDAARASAGETDAAGEAGCLVVFEAALYRLAMAADRMAVDEDRAAARPGLDRSAVPNPVDRVA